MAQRYSITKLELCGLAFIIASVSHLLKRVDVDVVIDHLALTHFMKSKSDPVTNKIKRLLEVLSSHTFNLYYLKGKGMVLDDSLSRMEGDNSNPHVVIPTSFNSCSILTGHYYTYFKLPSETQSYHQRHTK